VSVLVFTNVLVYEDYGWDIVSTIYAWPKSTATMWIADPDVIRVTTLNHVFADDTHVLVGNNSIAKSFS
jgi:hypothetical protein